MIIRQARRGESIRDIAAEYCISPQYLMGINGACGRELSDGRELIIPIPSRSITARVGDTVEGISHRFGVNVSQIYALNPEVWFSGRMYPAEYVVLGLAEPKIGVAAVNGQLYGAIPREKLKRALPYLNTLTVSGARADGGRIKIDGNMIRFAELGRDCGVRPILRIYIEKMQRGEWSDFLRGAIMLATSRGFSGIALGGVSRLGEEATEFTLFMRRGTLESGLSLSVEGDLYSECRYTEYADTAVMSLDKIHLPEIPDFDEFEARIISEKSENTDVSNMLLDIPSFALSGGEYIGKDDLFSKMDTRGAVVLQDDVKRIVRVKCGRKMAVSENTSNTEARIRLGTECGYLGFSVDLLRVPFSELFTLYAMTNRPMNLPAGNGTLNCRAETKGARNKK